MRWFLRAPPCIDVRGGASSVTARPLNKRPSQTHYSPSLTMWRRVIDDIPILRARRLVAILAVDRRHAVPCGWRSSTVVVGAKLSGPRLYISHRDPVCCAGASSHVSERQLPLSHGLFNSFGPLGASPTLPSPARYAPMHAWREGGLRAGDERVAQRIGKGRHALLSDANRPGPNADRGAHRALWSGSFCQQISNSARTPHPHTYIPRRCRDVSRTSSQSPTHQSLEIG